MQFSCENTSSENSQAGSTNEYAELYENSLGFAQELAKELSANAELKDELYEKLALKIDGDTEVLLDHLSENFKSKYKEKISALQHDFLLELRMPLSKVWSIQKIEDAGGLNIVVYPYGEDDRKITEVKGYQANGSEIVIKKQHALEKPFLLIAIAERVSKTGKLKYGKLKGVSVNMISFRKQQTKAPIVLAKDEFIYDMKRVPIEIIENLAPYDDDGYWGIHYCLENDLPFCFRRYDCISSPPPPPQLPKDKLMFEKFRTSGIDDGWMDGDLEVIWEIVQGSFNPGSFDDPSAFQFSSGAFNHDAGYWFWGFTNSNKVKYIRNKRAISERWKPFGIYNDQFQFNVNEEDTFGDDKLGRHSFRISDANVQGAEWSSSSKDQGTIEFVLKLSE